LGHASGNTKLSYSSAKIATNCVGASLDIFRVQNGAAISQIPIKIQGVTVKDAFNKSGIDIYLENQTLTT
jgi:hypothetical protein